MTTAISAAPSRAMANPVREGRVCPANRPREMPARNSIARLITRDTRMTSATLSSGKTEQRPEADQAKQYLRDPVDWIEQPLALFARNVHSVLSSEMDCLLAWCLFRRRVNDMQTPPGSGRKNTALFLHEH
ncbi:hypothetical protein P3T23_008276 [Paraburkholderia sp. GAS448]|uniref:hypothetical protein n=1 Tax=Paraburkholderia sp. GAS448 TaxID=3035136 RepID=UPI003D232F22